jgi:protein-L-isoaspartate O-methyltransferase
LQQLAEGGRLIAPVGEEDKQDKQELQLVTRREGKFIVERGGPCRFVPLKGRHGW